MSKIDEVPRVRFEELTNKVFYQKYLTNNLPVLVEGGCRDWPAYKKWNELSYLQE